MSKYWFQDLNLLIDSNKLDEFYPTKNMNHVEKTNALMRGSIYTGVIISLLQKNYLYLYIPIIVGFLTIILHYYKKVNDDSDKKIKNLEKQFSTPLPINDNTVRNNNNNIIKEGFQNSCSAPKQSNPFMNPLPFDNRTRPEACSYTRENKDKIENIYNKNLFREVGDIFNKQHGNRQFYTVPSTTYPNAQGDLGKWLYGTPKSCKEGNGNQCVANNQEKLNGASYQFPYLY